MSVIGQTTRTARAIMEVLRPLTGSPALGTATVTATGADIEVPKGCFFAPVKKYRGGSLKIDRDNLLRTREDTTVTSGGTSLGVISMLGGGRQNLEAGTVLRFDPPLAGVDEEAPVDALMTGGIDAGGVAAVKQIIEAEQIESASAALDIFNARASSGAPCIVLAWDSSSDSAKVGRGKSAQEERWTLFVIVSRADSSASRRSEGRDINDAIRGYLFDRGSVAGHVFSSPPARVLGRTRTAITKSAYVYAVQIETIGHTRRIEARGSTSPDGEMTWQEWRRTKLDVEHAQVPPFPVLVDDMIIPASQYDQTIEETALTVTDAADASGGTKPLGLGDSIGVVESLTVELL